MGNNLKRLGRFVWRYKTFNAVLLAVAAGLVLQIIGLRSAADILLGAAAILGLLPLMWSMWHDIQSGNYGIDVLAVTTVIASVILKQYWVAIVIVVARAGSEILEDLAERQARRDLDELIKQTPREAHVLRKGKTALLDTSGLHAGDKIIIEPGEQVPVDAVIIEGKASFDEFVLTGESLPQAKDKGDDIFSGSINLDGRVTAEATATAEASQYQRIVKLARNSGAAQTPFVKLADRYIIPFTLLSFAIASSMWALSGQAIRFLEVLVVATPGPLLLAGPVAIIGGMSRASRSGIIVRNGAALERLAGIRTLAFGKAGILTEGTPKVSAVYAAPSYSKEQVLSLAAGLEQSSSHTIAAAVVDAAREKGLKPVKAKRVSEIAGRGLVGTLKGEEVLAGRLSLLEEHEVKIPARFRRKVETFKQTTVYVASGSELIGVIALADELRPESVSTIVSLKNLGIKELVMMTGDSSSAAQAIADRLGITRVHAEVLSGDKLRVLGEARHRPLAFLGNGVSDVPILTASDLGVVLGAHGRSGSESADVTIVSGRLSRMAVALSIAKRTFRIARQSIMLGVGLSVVLMLVFATGKFPALAGAIIQGVISVVVIMNSLRARSSAAGG